MATSLPSHATVPPVPHQQLHAPELVSRQQELPIHHLGLGIWVEGVTPVPKGHSRVSPAAAMYWRQDKVGDWSSTSRSQGEAGWAAKLGVGVGASACRDLGGEELKPGCKSGLSAVAVGLGDPAFQPDRDGCGSFQGLSLCLSHQGGGGGTKMRCLLPAGSGT